MSRRLRSRTSCRRAASRSAVKCWPFASQRMGLGWYCVAERLRVGLSRKVESGCDEMYYNETGSC